MDDRRCACVQKVKTLEDLPAPTTQHLRLHHLETLQVPAADSAIKSWVLHVDLLVMLPSLCNPITGHCSSILKSSYPQKWKARTGFKSLCRKITGIRLQSVLIRLTVLLFHHDIQLWNKLIKWSNHVQSVRKSHLPRKGLNIYRQTHFNHSLVIANFILATYTTWFLQVDTKARLQISQNKNISMFVWWNICMEILHA